MKRCQSIEFSFSDSPYKLNAGIFFFFFFLHIQQRNGKFSIGVAVCTHSQRQNLVSPSLNLARWARYQEDGKEARTRQAGSIGIKRNVQKRDIFWCTHRRKRRDIPRLRWVLPVVCYRHLRWHFGARGSSSGRRIPGSRRAAGAGREAVYTEVTWRCFVPTVPGSIAQFKDKKRRRFAREAGMDGKKIATGGVKIRGYGQGRPLTTAGVCDRELEFNDLI